MNINDWLKKSGATPGKLVLVAVLAVVLVVVMVIQYQNLFPQGETLAQTRPAARKTIAKKSNTPVAAGSGAAEAVPDAPGPTWPEMTFKEVVANDPFAVPDWMLPPPPPPEIASTPESPDDQQELLDQQRQRAEQAVALAQLKQQGTQIVVLTDGDKIARIGDQSLRIGDTIEGFRITDITAAGVVLTAEKSP